MTSASRGGTNRDKVSESIEEIYCPISQVEHARLRNIERQRSIASLDMWDN